MSKAPKYFIKTNKGEVEFHCGYLPYRKVCWLAVVYFKKPEPDEIYEIGYDPYWGLDFIKYPERIAQLNDYGSAKAIISNRYARLESHISDLRWLCFLVLGYFVLVWLAYKASDLNPPQNLPYPDTTPSPLKPSAENSAAQTPNKSPSTQSRRSFFD
jgi:hypothetical protein